MGRDGSRVARPRSASSRLRGADGWDGVHLRSANVWVKVDLTGVVSSDLKVEIA